MNFVGLINTLGHQGDVDNGIGDKRKPKYQLTIK